MGGVSRSFFKSTCLHLYAAIRCCVCWQSVCRRGLPSHHTMSQLLCAVQVRSKSSNGKVWFLMKTEFFPPNKRLKKAQGNLFLIVFDYHTSSLWILNLSHFLLWIPSDESRGRKCDNQKHESRGRKCDRFIRGRKCDNTIVKNMTNTHIHTYIYICTKMWSHLRESSAVS